MDVAAAATLEASGPLLAAVRRSSLQPATCRNASWPSTSSGRAKPRTRSRSAPGRVCPSAVVRQAVRSCRRGDVRVACHGLSPVDSPTPIPSVIDEPLAVEAAAAATRSPARAVSGMSCSSGAARRPGARARLCRLATSWRTARQGTDCGRRAQLRRPPAAGWHDEPTTEPPGAHENDRRGPAACEPDGRRVNETVGACDRAGGSGRRRRRAARAPAGRSATTGRLVVTSNPAKADVTINGKWSGRTPLTVDDLKFGKYVVRVVQPGTRWRGESSRCPRRRVATRRCRRCDREGAGVRSAGSEARAPQAQPPRQLRRSRGGGDGRDLRRFAAAGRAGVHRRQGSRCHAAALTGSRSGRESFGSSWPTTSRGRDKPVVAGELARVTGSLERIR